MIELLARRNEIPVEQSVGVPPTTGAFIYSAVVGDGEPSVFRATVARYHKMGFVDFKVKLSGDASRDRAKIDAIRGLRDVDRIRVRVDANNLWNDCDPADRYLSDLAWPLVGIEEPLAPGALDGMRHLSDRTGVPIILDENMLRARQLAAIAGDPEHWILNVRVSKMGGLLRSLAFVKAAHDAGLRIIVGAQVGETSILTRAGLVVARAAGSNLVAQEGAFGTHLLAADVATPSLMFGRAGVLNTDALGLASKVGWGLTLRPPRDFAIPLSG